MSGIANGSASQVTVGTGQELLNVLLAKYGAEAVQALLRTELSFGLEDIFENPELLRDYTPEDIRTIMDQARQEGWRIETLGRGSHEGQGVAFAR